MRAERAAMVATLTKDVVATVVTLVLMAGRTTKDMLAEKAAMAERVLN